MKIQKSDLAIASIILISFLVTAAFYPRLPDRIASHWSSSDQPDGYAPKQIAFLLPVILIVLAGLLKFIPRLDPRRQNFASFQNYYDGLIILLCIFMFSLQYGMLLWNVGIPIPMLRIAIPGIAVLIYYTGILSKHTRPNWFVGIRTPWTLASDTVWAKTHQFGGTLFQLSALIILFSAFFSPEYLILCILIPILAAALITTIYSYLIFQKEKHRME